MRFIYLFMSSCDHLDNCDMKMTTGWISQLSLMNNEDRQDDFNNLKETCSIYFRVNSVWEKFLCFKKKKFFKKINVNAVSFTLDS